MSYLCIKLLFLWEFGRSIYFQLVLHNQIITNVKKISFMNSRISIYNKKWLLHSIQTKRTRILHRRRAVHVPSCSSQVTTSTQSLLFQLMLVSPFASVRYLPRFSLETRSRVLIRCRNKELGGSFPVKLLLWCCGFLQ